MNKVLLIGLGFLLGVLLLVGSFSFYFISGMVPAATAAPPMPFEKYLAKVALRSHTDKFRSVTSPVPADETNFIAGADVYKDHCASCHGLPGQEPPKDAAGLYPPAPLLFKGRGVSNNPVGVTYWKVTNGIRLTGMPSFNKSLSDTQMWQVCQLLAHSTKLPDSVKMTLVASASDTAPLQVAAQKAQKTAAK